MVRGGTLGAVAAGHDQTASAAAMILREGGNAFDAAIAGLWMACVVEPVLASPGGGGFLMALRNSGQRTNLFDFFVQTPRHKSPLETVEFSSVNVDFGTATQEFHIGAGSSAVPGFIPGLFAIHEALGSVPMARLAEQAVEAARRGITVNEFQATLLEIVQPIYVWTESARKLFAPSGHLARKGDGFRNGCLGDAIETTAREGVRIATEGEIARAMLESTSSTSGGGCLTLEDLKAYEVVVRRPEKKKYGGHSIFLNPPPSAGGTLIADMMNRAKSFGDEALSPVETASIIAATDRAWRNASCDLRRFSGHGSEKSGGQATRGTTHISVIDKNNNAASVTVSNGEGNGRIVPGCGFMVNNMLGEEDLNQGGFYAWRENARLASMMSPTLAISAGGQVAAIGSGGSNRIRSAVFQVLDQMISHQLAVEDAILAPRLHVELDHLDFEDFFEPGIGPALKNTFPDHLVWPERNMFFGGAHVVRKSPAGSLEAGGDPRRAGVAVFV